MIRILRAVACCLLLTGAAANGSDAPPLEPPHKQREDVLDPLLNKAWHLPRIGAFQAWKITRGNPAVSIAVSDSGIQYNHRDLSPNLRRNTREWPMNGQDDDGNGFIDDVIGWDFVRGRPLPWDRTGHGTFVAGIAAAAAGNGVGSAGVCPKCSILPLRFMNSDGLGWDEDGLDALRYAIQSGVSIINISFAGEGYDYEYHQVLREAAARDIVVVAAAGNDGENIDRTSVYPPKFRGLPNMIVVAAVDRLNALIEDDAGGSNWSKNFVHIAAPGEGIVGPWNDGTYESLDGTSYSAPIVAGAAGLVRSANPKLSAVQVVRILMATARQNPALQEKLMSGGVLNAAAAVQCAVTPGLPCLRTAQARAIPQR